MLSCCFGQMTAFILFSVGCLGQVFRKGLSQTRWDSFKPPSLAVVVCTPTYLGNSHTFCGCFRNMSQLTSRISLGLQSLTPVHIIIGEFGVRG